MAGLAHVPEADVSIRRERDYVPTSSTEIAALNGDVPMLDPVHTTVTKVIDLLGVLAPTLERIDAELGRLDRYCHDCGDGFSEPCPRHEGVDHV